MDKTAEAMFAYLRDVLYDPKNASLDVETLPEDFKQLGQGLLYLGNAIDEQRDLAKALARGNLSVKLPPPDNELAAPLKAMHASLKHLTWQSQQVAKGDYKQRVEFMGEFAEAFNSMTIQLEQRQRALEEEIEKSRQKTLALEQSNSLFEAITAKISQWILVVDAEDGEWLFLNSVAEEALGGQTPLRGLVEGWVRRFVAETQGTEEEGAEFTFSSPTTGEPTVMMVAAYPMQWRQRNAIALVMSDVSASRAQMQKLEEYAYQDNLTKVSSRFYGMQMLKDWKQEGRRFCICFADLDNLKYVNDTFGHSEGDQYIIAAANAMLATLPDATISRLGGDEFMVLIPDCGIGDGEQAMQRVRDILLKKGGKGQHRYRRSLSYGVVQVDESQKDVSASTLLSLADDRMYEFKRVHKKKV